MSADAPRIVVVVPTIARRRDSLVTCLRALAKQTLLPDEVHLVGDGMSALDVPPEVCAAAAKCGTQVELHENRLGCGRRWLHIEKLPPGCLAICVDDDLQPGPTYIEDTVGAWRWLGGVVTWNPNTNTGPAAQPAMGISGGLCAVPCEAMEGISTAPLVQECFQPGRALDVLVSAVLYAKGVPTWSMIHPTMDWSAHFQPEHLNKGSLMDFAFTDAYLQHLHDVYQTYGFVSGHGLPSEPLQDWRPWMSGDEIASVLRILQSLPGAARVLEWGAGGSTVRFAAALRARRGTVEWQSIEYNRRWHEKVRKEAGEGVEVTLFDVGNDEIQQRDTNMDAYVDFPLTLGKEFEMVLVDGRKRRRCMAVAKQVLAPGGVVLLHDAQRDYYQCALGQFRFGRMLTGTLWGGANDEAGEALLCKASGVDS